MQANTDAKLITKEIKRFKNGLIGRAEEKSATIFIDGVLFRLIKGETVVNLWIQPDLPYPGVRVMPEYGKLSNYEIQQGERGITFTDYGAGLTLSAPDLATKIVRDLLWLAKKRPFMIIGANLGELQKSNKIKIEVMNTYHSRQWALVSCPDQVAREICKANHWKCFRAPNGVYIGSENQRVVVKGGKKLTGNIYDSDITGIPLYSSKRLPVEPKKAS